MRLAYATGCSGIEAPSVAWEPLGWEPQWFAQFDPEHNYANGLDFPSAVLAHRYPNVPNLFDMLNLPNLIRTGAVDAPDVFIAGTPCQSFSVAGLRKGLSDERGNVTLAYIQVLNEIDKRRDSDKGCIGWWENVPGVLSSKDNAFGCLLGGLVGEEKPLVPPGKRWSNAGIVLGPQRSAAWRVLDAQYFGLAQRRKRVFVVTSSRAGFDPASVLFEFDGMRRDTPPSRETGQSTAANVAQCLKASGAGTARVGDTRGQDNVVAHGFRMSAFGEYQDDQTASTMKARDYKDATDLAVAIPIQNATRGKSQNGLGIANDSDPMYTLDQASQHAVAIQDSMIGRSDKNGPQGDGLNDEVSFTLNTTDRHAVAVHGTQDPIIGDNRTHALGRNNGAENAVYIGGVDYENNAHSMDDPTGPLLAGSRSGGGRPLPAVVSNAAVRRLTPVECARLQGFPDNHTEIPWKVRVKHPAGAGPCAKQVVKATVVCKNGTHFSSTNYCKNPQAVCPREIAGFKSGEGYSLCKTVCQQVGHAEQNAIAFAGKKSKDATLFLEGHTYACDGCKKAAKQAGIKQIVVGPPPGNAPDGPQYKAYGNSMATRVIRWLGQRTEKGIK